MCYQVSNPISSSQQRYLPANINARRHASNLTTTTTQQPQQHSLPPRRPFSTTPSLLKKGGKAARDESKSQAASQGKDAAPTDDPSDFSALEADIAAAVERLKDDLSKLRAGGRFNPELLENLRVQPDKNNTAKVRLSDVAQVVRKGRTVQVLVGEKDVRYNFSRGNIVQCDRTNDSTHSTSNPSPPQSKALPSLSRPSQIPQARILSSS